MMFSDTYDMVQKAHRQYILNILNVQFNAEQWLDLKNISTGKLKKIFLRLYEESFRGSVATPHNSAVLEKNSIYGYNVPYFTPMLLDALIICREYANQKKQAILIDLGCGWGAGIWKFILAGCKVYALDIGFTDKKFKDGFESTVTPMVSKKLYNNHLIILSTSLYDLPKEHPELMSLFDIVYAANVLHFYTPSYFNVFADIINKLLYQPSSTAFISVNSVHLIIKENPSCLAAFKHNKDNDYAAPGYLFTTHIYQKNNPRADPYADRTCHIKDRVIIENADSLSSLVSLDVLSSSAMLVGIYEGYFDTESLSKIFNSHEGLVVLAGYYFNIAEKRLSCFADNNYGLHGVAVEIGGCVNKDILSDTTYTCDLVPSI